MALGADVVAWFDKVVEAFQLDNTKLSDWEMNFMKDQIDRYGKYGDDIRFSDKQWGIVDRIAGKLGIREPRPEHGASAPALPERDPDDSDGFDDEVPF